MGRLRWNITLLPSGILRREFRPSRPGPRLGNRVVMVLAASRRARAGWRPPFAPEPAVWRPRIRGSHERSRLTHRWCGRFTIVRRRAIHGGRPSSVVRFRDAHAGSATSPRQHREVGRIRHRAGRRGRLDVAFADDYCDGYNDRVVIDRQRVSCGADAAYHGRRQGTGGGDEARGECGATDASRTVAQSGGAEKTTRRLADGVPRPGYGVERSLPNAKRRTPYATR